jgi:hypothetical protein
MQSDRMKVSISKPSSTTRSLDTRSTSCDKDEAPNKRWKELIKTKSFDSRLPHLRGVLIKNSQGKAQFYEHGERNLIEPVLEEEEAEVVHHNLRLFQKANSSKADCTWFKI